MNNLSFVSRPAVIVNSYLDFAKHRASLDITQKGPYIDYVLDFQLLDTHGPVAQYDSYRFAISVTSDYHNLCTLGEKIFNTNDPNSFAWFKVTLLYVESAHEHEPNICAIGNESGTEFVIPSYFLVDDPKLKELTTRTVTREETEQILRNNIV